MARSNAALAAICSLVAVARGALVRGKGFLALDQEAADAHTRAVPLYAGAPGLGKIWLATPAAAPGSPLLLNFSVNVVRRVPPCKQRIQDCRHHSRACLARLADYKLEIKDTRYKLNHMASDHPLLNTLAIKSEVHRKALPEEKTSLSGPYMEASSGVLSGLLPENSQSTMVYRLDHLLPEAEWADAISGPNFQVGGEKQMKDPFQVAADQIAEHIASSLPSGNANNAARSLNQTCTSIENITIGDCQSFVQACMEQLSAKDQTLKGWQTKFSAREEMKQKARLFGETG